MDTARITAQAVPPRSKKSKATPAELREHALLLAHNNSFKVRQELYQAGNAQVWLKERIVICSPIRSALTYFIVLHELGHVLNDRSKKADTELWSEFEAWQWAIDRALIHPPDPIKRRIGGYLKTYHDKHSDLAKRLRMDVRFPPKGTLYWKMLDWAENPPGREQGVRRLP